MFRKRERERERGRERKRERNAPMLRNLKKAEHREREGGRARVQVLWVLLKLRPPSTGSKVKHRIRNFLQSEREREREIDLELLN